jgi:hypothetical protein
MGLYNISRETWRKINQIWKSFIIHNRRIKSYLDVGVPFVECNAMIRYILHKYKLANMKK